MRGKTIHEQMFGNLNKKISQMRSNWNKSDKEIIKNFDCKKVGMSKVINKTTR